MNPTLFPSSDLSWGKIRPGRASQAVTAQGRHLLQVADSHGSPPSDFAQARQDRSKAARYTVGVTHLLLLALVDHQEQLRAFGFVSNFVGPFAAAEFVAERHGVAVDLVDRLDRLALVRAVGALDVHLRGLLGRIDRESSLVLLPSRSSLYLPPSRNSNFTSLAKDIDVLAAEFRLFNLLLADERLQVFLGRVVGFAAERGAREKTARNAWRGHESWVLQLGGRFTSSRACR